MRNASVWQRVLGLARTVIEAEVFDEDAEAVVVSVRPRKGRAAALRTVWAAGSVVRSG